MKTLIIILILVNSLIVSSQPPNSLDSNSLSPAVKEQLSFLSWEMTYPRDFIRTLREDATNRDLEVLLNHPSHEVRFYVFMLLRQRGNGLTDIEIIRRNLNDNPELDFIRSCIPNGGIMDNFIGMSKLTNSQKDSLIEILLTIPNELKQKNECLRSLEDNEKHLNWAVQLATKEDNPFAIIPIINYRFHEEKDLILKYMNRWLFQKSHNSNYWNINRYFHKAITKNVMDHDVFQLLKKYNELEKKPNDGITKCVNVLMKRHEVILFSQELMQEYQTIEKTDTFLAETIYNKLKAFDNKTNVAFNDLFKKLWKEYGLVEEWIIKHLEKSEALIERKQITKYSLNYGKHLETRLNIQGNDVKKRLLKNDVNVYVRFEEKAVSIQLLQKMLAYPDNDTRKLAIIACGRWLGHHRDYKNPLIDTLFEELNDFKNKENIGEIVQQLTRYGNLDIYDKLKKWYNSNKADIENSKSGLWIKNMLLEKRIIGY